MTKKRTRMTKSSQCAAIIKAGFASLISWNQRNVATLVSQSEGTYIHLLPAVYVATVCHCHGRNGQVTSASTVRRFWSVLSFSILKCKQTIWSFKKKLCCSISSAEGKLFKTKPTNCGCSRTFWPKQPKTTRRPWRRLKSNRVSVSRTSRHRASASGPK